MKEALKPFLRVGVLGLIVAVVLLTLAGMPCYGQQGTSGLEMTEEGLTLWEIIRSGGVIMIILGVMSLISLTLIINYFITLRVSKEIPEDFLSRAYSHLYDGDLDSCRSLCYETNCIISKVLETGLEAADKDRTVIQESMESVGAREASNLWQRISYLSDIAVLAPMLGILGTVLGMIRAFNAIAFEAGVVKPIALAGGVSQALVTTAAGLIIAIPVMGFYFYFRGRVQRIVVSLEGTSIQLMERLLSGRRSMP